MEQTINFSSDTIGFGNLKFFTDYVKNNNPDFYNSEYRDKNFEHLRYFYPEIKKNNNSIICLTSEVTFDNRIRYYHITKLLQPIKFLVSEFLSIFYKSNNTLTLILKNYDNSKISDKWFFDLLYGQIKKENLSIKLYGGGFDSNPKIPLSISTDAKYIDTLKEHFNHEYDGDALSLFKDSMDKAQYEDAIKSGNLYLRNNPFDYDIELFLGLAYVMSNLPEKGEAHYKHILDNSDDPKLISNVYYSLSMIYMRHYGKLGKNENKAEYYLNKGKTIILNNKDKLGDEYDYQRIFNRNGIALIEFKNNNLELATEYCEDGQWQLFYLYGNKKHLLHRAVLLYNCTMTTEAQKKYNDSLKYFYTLLSIDPYFPDYWVHKSKLDKKMGNIKTAFESINRAIDLNPYEDSLYRLRALMYIENKEYQKAIIDLKRALKINPLSEETYEIFSAVLISVGKIDLVQNLLDNISFEQFSSLVVNLSTALSEMNENDQALKQLDSFVGNTNIDLVYANKAVILYKTKKFKEALENINIAISYNSKNKEFIINKLILLDKISKRDSEKYFDTVKSLFPNENNVFDLIKHKDEYFE